MKTRRRQNQSSWQKVCHLSFQRINLSSFICFCVSHSVVSNSPGSSVHGLLQARILECHSPLQGIFLTQGSNLSPPALQADSLLSELSGKSFALFVSTQSLSLDLFWFLLFFNFSAVFLLF